MTWDEEEEVVRRQEYEKEKVAKVIIEAEKKKQ